MAQAIQTAFRTWQGKAFIMALALAAVFLIAVACSDPEPTATPTPVPPTATPVPTATPTPEPTSTPVTLGSLAITVDTTGQDVMDSPCPKPRPPARAGRQATSRTRPSLART